MYWGQLGRKTARAAEKEPERWGSGCSCAALSGGPGGKPLLHQTGGKRGTIFCGIYQKTARKSVSSVHRYQACGRLQHTSEPGLDPGHGHGSMHSPCPMPRAHRFNRESKRLCTPGHTQCHLVYGGHTGHGTAKVAALAGTKCKYTRHRNHEGERAENVMAQVNEVLVGRQGYQPGRARSALRGSDMVCRSRTGTGLTRWPTMPLRSRVRWGSPVLSCLGEGWGVARISIQS